MSVYTYTFRTGAKWVSLDGSMVQVYPYRYLCHLNDLDDHWGERKRRAALMNAQVERAGRLFDEHGPQYAIQAGDVGESWEGCTVYANPKGPVWHDTDSFPGQPIGFIGRGYRRLVVIDRYARQTTILVAGREVVRHYENRIQDGQVISVPLSYELDDKRLSPAEFEAWREQATPLYLTECERKRIEQEAEDKRQREAAERAAKVRALENGIAAAQQQLKQLEAERAALG